ncbi:CRISPR-associated helicase Cas3' [Thermopolyspora sp. NPDC052614]|uniref:CRISPR-associated helicase Cas3' n=1 Tax=Thermopolyspora sp. NPDC052614 TaxID=3155682 RepID=UPI00341B5C80
MSLHEMLAKSSPRETLTAHLEATLAGAEALRRRIGRIKAVEPVIQDVFWIVVRLAALCHDAGKIPEGFQAMLRGRSRFWGERHEAVSLGFLPALLPDGPMRLWVATGVVTHHRPIEGGGRSLLRAYGRADEDEWRKRLPVPGNVADELTEWLSRTARRAGLPVRPDVPVGMDVTGAARQVFEQVVERWEPPASMEEGLAAVLVQGAVTLADHLSSAHGTLHSRQPLDGDFPRLLAARFAEKGHRLRPHQRQAGAADGHLLLRAPTGSGKTESGLLWASAQVAAIARAVGGTPRVFFTLPYLASINAMAVRLGELLGDGDLVGVMHSRAASYHLATAICPEDGDEERAEAAKKAVARAAATRLFQETVRVGTPYQLLRGALAGPAYASVLVDAANSVFVLDELHAYDPLRLGYILAMTRLWERLGGRVAVLSATLPESLADLFRDVLDGTIHQIDADASGAARRHRLRLRDRHLTDPETVAEIAGRLDGGESVLVVANNVADAQHVFAELSPRAETAYLLHSRFRRMDRAAIEDGIRRRFGVGRPRCGGLVVATQVVEVSLDVDFDCLFTSAAPLEALLQRFGRVNRVAERPAADVVVHAPAYGPRRKGGEDYADGVYPRLPVEMGWDILTRHDGEEVDEGEARVWLDEVYASDWGRGWRKAVGEHLTRFEDAFLTFAHPFAARDDLGERFDQLFDGTEAVLAQDRDAYEAALEQVDDVRAAGRLLAERYLIPMPYWAAPLTTWEKRLGVRVVEAEYDERLGLGEIHGPVAQVYQAGEVL